MDFIEKDLLAGELVPILLGVSPEAVQTARRYFKYYGTLSHLFCEKLFPLFRLTYCMKFHVIGHSKEDRLMLTALLDYATQLGNKDIILYLIPCTVRHANFVWRNRAELERYFVIADRPEMERVWYGDTAEGKE